MLASISNFFYGNDKNRLHFDNYIKFLYKLVHYDTSKIFYVCSFGGSGSYMLCNYLENFGKVYHIHSRFPPKKLTYIGEENTNEPVYSEWFNETEIPETHLANYTVIYIYKDPVSAIYSRFDNPGHLEHIQCDTKITLHDIIQTKKDLYKIEEFFDQYTSYSKRNSKRNYKIHCVKYENFWDNISTFNKTFRLPDIKELYPERKESTRVRNNEKHLTNIYYPLIKKMEKMQFIEIR